YPILGDELYGGSKVMVYGINRQALHSSYLSFNDPFCNKKVEFFAELPDDMLQIVTKYGFKY
ncbi:MAG: RNA pseudouridine synthase, partial [Deferribacterales bacterium]